MIQSDQLIFTSLQDDKQYWRVLTFCVQVHSKYQSYNIFSIMFHKENTAQKIKTQDCFEQNMIKFEDDLSKGMPTENQLLNFECKIQYFQASNSQDEISQKLLGENNHKRKKNIWRKEELDLLKNLYCKLGPNWVQIGKSFTQRTVCDLKNWFSNTLRKITKRLQSYSWKIKEKMQKYKKSYLLSFFKIIQEVERIIPSLDLVINPKCKLMRLKFLLTELCFNINISDAYFDEFIKLSHFFGQKLKCLGVFKMKNRNGWKLCLKSFHGILLVDDLISDRRQQVFIKQEEIIKAEEFSKGPIHLL